MLNEWVMRDLKEKKLWRKSEWLEIKDTEGSPDKKHEDTEEYMYEDDDDAKEVCIDHPKGTE